MYEAITDPEFLGCMLVYGLMFLGAWIIDKLTKDK